MPDNLYKRRGTWYGRIQVRGREIRKSLRTGALIEARKRLKKMRDDLDHLRFYGEERHTWKAAAGRWLEEIGPSLKPATFKRYRVSLKQLRPILDHLYLDEINLRTIAKVAGRRGVTNATRRRDLTAVSSVLRSTVAWGWREDNPAKAWDRSIVRETRLPIDPPSDADIAAVRAIAPAMMVRMMDLALQTGMRQGEIVYLEHAQVRLQELEILLTRTKTNAPRIIPVSDPLLVRGVVGTITGTPRHIVSKYVFWHHDGRPFKQFATSFATVRDRAGATFRFHDLRHRFAIDYLKRGGNIYNLQKILGHSSITTTEIYLNYLSPDQQRLAKFGDAG